MRMPIVALVTLVALVAAACSGDDDGDVVTDTSAGETATGETLRVPDDHGTIRAAVSAASPGDLVLIAPGVYREAVDVETENLTIRGLDRNEVVLDGGFELENGIRVLADGVAVENLTARNYRVNGFFWTGVTGYRGSYLTAFRNGDYGVYAFDSVQGQFDHIYAAGSPDAGVYIGQCYPCDAVVTDVVSEHNGLGYSGTNAGGNLLLVSSIWRNNRAGIVPNSGSYELCYPQRGATIVGNTVYANNQADTPAIDAALLAMGNGILLTGGNRNVIERNLVYDHERTGIGLVPYPEEEASDLPPDEPTWETPCAETRNTPPSVDDPSALGLVLWDSAQNRVVGNVVSGSGLADLAVGAVATNPATLGNCFSGNTFGSTAPAALEALAPCDADPTADDWTIGALDLLALIAAERPPSVDYETAPLPDPGPQEHMPDAATAPPRPATDVPMEIDLDAITVPARQ
jgi:hypothetical protein